MAAKTDAKSPSTRTGLRLPKRGASDVPRRKLREHVTSVSVVAVVAAVLTFVLVAAALNDRRAMVTVAVAARDIPAGQRVTGELVRSVEMPASVSFADELVAFDVVADGDLVATRTVLSGEPLTDASVGSAAEGVGQRVMSIPLAAAQAADGKIEVGDRVDVIHTTDGGPRYVLTGAEVVGRSSGGGGIVSGGSQDDLVLTVVVNDQEALAVAAALEDGEVTVVRSTGAPIAVPPALPAPSDASAPPTSAGG